MHRHASMNKIFRTIWNHARQCFVMVGETAKSHTKAKSSRAGALILSAGSFVLMSATALAADLPTGGEIVGGSGTISQSGNVMTINQTTAKMAADWQSFSIGAGNTVNFVQPSASSVALNRVLGSDISVIQGALNANGQVFLINPNGVLFTPTAQVNVGGIVASTLNMSTVDFMAGNYKFEGASSNAIINQGNITAVGDGSGGGTIALIAAKITNTGNLTAHKGNVLLGVGSKVTLDLGGPVKLQVTQGQIDALIESGGAINADGGTVLLTAKAVGDLAISVINHAGLIEAQTLATGEKGQITLLGEGELITVSGKLDVSAPSGGVGGRIVATGTRVLIDQGAHLTASGQHGGGEVLVGGSWQNEDASVYQATATLVAPTAKLEASAIDNGNGGTVVAWSDIHNEESVTRAYGIFEAKGGVNGGDGGRIETSGAFLDVNHIQPTTDAPKGNKGLWLLDPVGITISSAANAFPGGEWNGSTSFNNTSNDAVINANDLVNWVQANNLIVQTTGYLTVASPINYSSSNYLILQAGGSLSVNANIINNSNGYIRLVTTEGSSGSISGSGNISTGGMFRLLGSLGNTTGSLSGTITASEMELTSIQYTFQNNTVTLSNNLITFAGTNPVALINTASQLSTKTFSGSSGLVRLNTHATIGGLSNIWKLDTSFYTATISGDGGGGVGSIEGSGAVVLNKSQNFNYWGNFPGSITINSGGSTALNENLTHSNPIEVNAGGTLNISNNVTLGNNLSTLAGSLFLNSGSTLTLNRSSALTIGGALGGSGILNLNASSGNPLYTFNAAGGHSGAVNIGSGSIVHMGNADALGGSGAITVNSGGTLRLGSVSTNSSKSLTLNGAGVSGQNGVLSVNSGTGTFGGNITLGSATTIGTNGGNLTTGGTINGAHALTVNAANTVTFNGAISTASLTKNWSGSTTINANITTTGAQNYTAGSVSIAGARTLSSDGTFDFTWGATSNNSNLILQSNGANLALTGSVATGTGWLNLRRASGTTGTLSSSGTLSGSGLLVQNFATANLTGTNNFATISANNIGTAFNYTDQDAVTIATVNSVSGLALGSATGNVATKTGDLTISQNISSTNTTASALTLNAGSDSTAGTSTGGNIIRSGTPTISVGTGGIIKLYTGSILGTTGWGGTTLTSGSGRFRYGSDESTTAYTKALSTGLNLIYREQPTIGASISSASKTYDGLVYDGTPSLTYSLQNGDTAGTDITFGTSVISGDITNPNAGTYTISAALSGFTNTLGYINPTAATAGTLTINKRALNLTGTRVYDASTSVDFSALTLGNLVTGQQLVLSGAGSVATKIVANNKAVTLGTLALADGVGGLANNYTFTGSTYTVNITKADITGVSNITSAGKVYDGNATAPLTTGSAAFTGRLGVDVLTVATATGTFNSPNVWDANTVTVSGMTLGGADAGNYNYVEAAPFTTTASITARPLTLTPANIVATREYNGVADTTATVTAWSAFNNIVGADTASVNVAVGSVASYLDGNRATGKTVNITGITLGGSQAGNYSLPTTLTSTTGIITAKALGISFSGTPTKVYDGTTFLDTTSLGLSLTGIVGTEDVTTSGAFTASFVDKNVGINKSLSFANLALTGTESGNYTLNLAGVSTNASITRLDSVTWTGGGGSTNWFDPANWGGKIPDLANVANVVIPDGVNVSFNSGTGPFVGLAQTGTVSLDSVSMGGGTTGAMSIAGGALNVATSLNLAGLTQTGGTLGGAGNVTVATFNQNGGSVANSGNFTVSNSFTQTGTSGTIAVGGNVGITQVAGGVVLGNINAGGTLGVTSQGAMTQTTGTTLVATSLTTLASTTADITLANATNDFGTVNASGVNISLKDTDDLDAVLTATGNSTVNAGGNLAVSGTSVGLSTTTTGTGTTSFGITTLTGNLASASAGAISQTGKLAVAGTTGFSVAGQTITLTDATNDFGGLVTATGSNILLSDANALNVALTASGNSTLAAGGALAVSGTTTNLNTTTSGTNSTTSFGITTVSGSLNTTSTGDVSQTGKLAVTGTTGITATGKNVTLDDATNDFGGTATVTGADVSMADTNGLTAVLNATGTSTLNAAGNLAVSGNSGSLDTTTTAGGTTSFGVTNVTTGNLAVISAGAVGQTGALLVAGTSGFSAAGQAVTMDNPDNNFTGAVSATGANVALKDVNALVLGNVAATGTLGLTAGGNMTQASGTHIAATGASTLVSTSGDVLLTESANDFANTVNASGVNVSLTDANGLTAVLNATGTSTLNAAGNLVVSGNTANLTTTTTGTGTTTLGLSALTGNLDVTSAGAVGQTAAVSVGGTANFSAVGQAVTLTDPANNFVGAVSATALNLSLVDADVITLGNITTTGTLGVTAAGDISQANPSTIAAAGVTTLASTTGSIALAEATNNFGTINASGVNISLADTNGITLGNITTTSTLDVAANGNVDQTGTLNIGTNANIGAGTGNVTITTAANTFGGSVGASGANVTISDDADLQLGNITASGALAVTSTAGAITQAGGSSIAAAGVSSLTAATDITLSNGNNNFVGAVNATGTNIALSDADALTLGNIVASGTFGASAENDILQAIGTSIAATGESTLASTSGNITLANATNNFVGAVNASATNIALKDTNALTLGNIVASGTFGATAVNDITQANGTSIVATGVTTLASTSGNITLENATNNFVGALNASGADVSLADTNGITLGNITTTSTLDVATNGNVDQTGTLNIGTNANIGAGTGNVTITTAANTFGGSVGASGANVTISDDADLQLGNITASGALAVTSTAGAITQAGGSSIAVAGVSSLTAATDITLSNTTNNFVGAVNASGVNVALADADAMTLGNIVVSGTFGAYAENDILQAIGTSIKATGETTLASTTGNITLESLTNNFVGAVNASGANVTLVDGTGGIILGAITATGNFGVTSASGAITQTGVIAVDGSQTIVDVAADAAAATAAGGPIGTAIATAQASANPTFNSDVVNNLLSEPLSNLASSIPVQPVISIAGFKVVEVNLEDIDKNADETDESDSVNNALGSLIKTAMSDQAGGSPLFLVLDKGIKMPQEADDDNLRRRTNSR